MSEIHSVTKYYKTKKKKFALRKCIICFNKLKINNNESIISNENLVLKIVYNFIFKPCYCFI